ncbi:hypothetical protein ACPWSR_17945 [Alloiococcus sp. CFN-8]|uniref:hypothetical protein n=1 Tax=Alloiococcus sp. CFN-8 TaxID=3416081 RepID=UPI003CEE0439
MKKYKSSIKIFPLWLILFLFISGSRAYAIDNSITLSLDNKVYSISLPDGWSIKNNGEYSEFLRGDIALGGYYTTIKSKVLADYKLEEISTAIGSVGIYRNSNTGHDNKLYALFSQKSDSPAIFLYTSEDTIERDKFILKMLLINIRPQE